MCVFVEHALDYPYIPGWFHINLFSDQNPLMLGKILHGDSSVLGFGDGHAESHKWKDRSAIEWNNNLRSTPWSPSSEERVEDLRYMQDGHPYRSLLGN